MNRPSHTAWVDSACCAIATGCRVWIGITAVPSSIRVVARPMSATAVSASKSFGTCGTQIDAKPACSAASASATSSRDLVAVAAPLGADHQADPHRVPLPPSDPSRGRP